MLSQTTKTIIPGVGVGTSFDDLNGEIIGTGADGTTYAVSATVSGIDATCAYSHSAHTSRGGLISHPFCTFTVTLVEDATHLSQFLEVTEGITLQLHEECGLDSDHVGTCTIINTNNVLGHIVATTDVIEGTITLNPIVVSTSSGLELDAAPSSTSSGAASTSANSNNNTSNSGAVSMNSFAVTPTVATVVSGFALLASHLLLEAFA